MPFEKYGEMWPDGTTELDINRYFYLHSDDPERRFRHMRAGCKIMFPELMPDQKTRGHIWNYWTDRRARAWCNTADINRMIWIGPASSGKSTDCALFCIWDFLCDPQNTSIRIATNSKECLDKRMWSEIERFWCLYPEGFFPATYKPSTMEIIAGPKGYITGIAVQKGTEQQAMDSIKGAHAPRVRVICDEFDAMPMGTKDAIMNASTGCETFIFVGTGNPVRRMGNPLGDMSEPENGDWSTVGPHLEQWKTKYGVLLYFDGLKSPGVANPEKFGKFLLNQKQIDDCVKTHGENSPIYWSQRRGFFPPEDASNSIIDEPMLTQFSMMKPASWISGYQMGLALDPSQSTGGDRCMVRPFAVGDIHVWRDNAGELTDRPVFADSRQALVLFPLIQIKLELSKDRTLTDFIAMKMKEIVDQYGVPPNLIAVDCTANQGAIADYLEAKLGRGIYRITYSGSAGRAPLDAMTNERHKNNQRAFVNKRAEMYYAFRMFGRWHQIKGLDRDTGSELTMTEWKNPRHPYQVEDKEEVKRKIGKSPDAGDVTVMALDLARYRMHLVPAGEESEKGLQDDRATRNYDSEMYSNLFTEPAGVMAVEV